jgi:hypothetical protein
MVWRMQVCAECQTSMVEAMRLPEELVNVSESDMLTFKCWTLSSVASFIGELLVSEAQNGELPGSDDVPVSLVSSLVREISASESQNGEVLGSEHRTEHVPVSSVSSFFGELLLLNHILKKHQGMSSDSLCRFFLQTANRF